MAWEIALHTLFNLEIAHKENINYSQLSEFHYWVGESKEQSLIWPSQIVYLTGSKSAHCSYYGELGFLLVICKFERKGYESKLVYLWFKNSYLLGIHKQYHSDFHCKYLNSQFKFLYLRTAISLSILYKSNYFSKGKCSAFNYNHLPLFTRMCLRPHHDVGSIPWNQALILSLTKFPIFGGLLFTD